MKRIIRSNMFETNSSSTHAICICTDTSLLKELKHPAYLYFGIGTHGWEFESLSSPKEKANYLYTGILDCYGGNCEDKIEKLKDMLLSFGCTPEFEEPKWSKYGDEVSLSFDCGYVDHATVLRPFIEKILDSPDLLYSYLFSDYSYILKGNDNSEDEPTIEEDYEHYEYYKDN